jgi:hypothetical protein
MIKPTIFVTQVPMRRDPATQGLVPGLDLSPANTLGQVVVLMPSQAMFLDTLNLMSQLRMKLHTYNHRRGDCLLTLGDPVINAVAITVLAAKGPFCILRWNKHLREYAQVHITP